jgi:hypothetical protein
MAEDALPCCRIAPSPRLADVVDEADSVLERSLAVAASYLQHLATLL